MEGNGDGMRSMRWEGDQLTIRLIAMMGQWERLKNEVREWNEGDQTSEEDGEKGLGI